MIYKKYESKNVSWIISIYRDENTVIQELSKYMNQGGAKLIVQNLSSNIDVLDDEEIFSKDIKYEDAW